MWELDEFIPENGVIPAAEDHVIWLHRTGEGFVHTYVKVLVSAKLPASDAQHIADKMLEGLNGQARSS